MRVRKRRQDGKPFLSCSGFPECDYTEMVATEPRAEPNEELDLSAFSETAKPVRDAAVLCLDDPHKHARALGRAAIVLLDYVVMWKDSDDSHAWDALDLATSELAKDPGEINVRDKQDADLIQVSFELGPGTEVEFVDADGNEMIGTIDSCRAYPDGVLRYEIDDVDYKRTDLTEVGV